MRARARGAPIAKSLTYIPPSARPLLLSRTRDRRALAASGLNASAVNLAAVPSDPGSSTSGRSSRPSAPLPLRGPGRGRRVPARAHPVFYVRAAPAARRAAAASAPYKAARTPRARARRPCARASPRTRRGARARRRRVPPRPRGRRARRLRAAQAPRAECVARGAGCLGDCPDAAYFAPHVGGDGDDVATLALDDDELHVVALVDHRATNASVCASVAARERPTC